MGYRLLCIVTVMIAIDHTGLFTIELAQAEQIRSRSVEEKILYDFADLDELRASCPPGTNLVGPIGPNGTRITVNGRSAAACMRPDGTSHGPSMTWYEDGSKASSGDYRNGVKEGLWCFWHENGRISGRGVFRDGKPDGVWVSWYDNQQKESEGSYFEGKHHGQFTYWDRSGHIVKVLKYDHGKLLDE